MHTFLGVIIFVPNKKVPMELPQCGICYIVPEQGYTMRIYSSFIIAILWTVFAAGLSSAQMMDESCHDNEGMSGVMAKPVCCCSQSMTGLSAESDDSLIGPGCCLPQTCTVPLVSTEIVLRPLPSPDNFSGVEQKLLVFQAASLLVVDKGYLELPPPRPPPAPIYIQNSSFLI